MNLEKITTTLYDVLGYILPGFIVLFAFCVLESTFLDTHALYLGRVAKHPLFAAILAYFVGTVIHALSSWLKDKFRAWFPREKEGRIARIGRGVFTDQNCRLNDRLTTRIKEEICEFYELEPDEVLADEKDRLSTLEMYQLSEAYVSTTGSFTDRDIYLAHEGFAKSAMTASALLCTTLLVSLIRGGARVQVSADRASVIDVHILVTIFFTLSVGIVANILRLRFLFFSRLKNNSTMLAFLARRLKDKPVADDKVAEPSAEPPRVPTVTPDAPSAQVPTTSTPSPAPASPSIPNAPSVKPEQT